MPGRTGSTMGQSAAEGTAQDCCRGCEAGLPCARRLVAAEASADDRHVAQTRQELLLQMLGGQKRLEVAGVACRDRAGGHAERA